MNRARKSRLLLTVFAASMLLSVFAAAQSTTPAATPQKPKPPFKEDELAALLAPVALYPDKIVTQILMASTYPLEVVEANRWLQANSTLKGDALAKEAQKQPWDPSVQALTAIPDVLKMMDEKLDWTQKVGDAVLAQQKEVLAMIQTLRAKAKDAGNLKSDEKMKVTTQAAPAPAAAPATATATATAEAAPAQVIVIESSNPEVVYVPTYTASVYGAWGYPAYPPYYWPPPMGYPGSGFWWGVGVGVSIGIWGGAWDNDCDWNGGNINTGDINIGGGDRDRVDHRQDARGDRQDNRGDNRGDRQDNRGDNRGDRGQGGNASNKKSWSHNPEHRKGVSYRDSGSQQKFDRASQASASRESFRGRTSAGTSDFGGRSGASAGTSDFRSGGAGNRQSSGAGSNARDLGSTGSRGGSTASAGTRDVGSSSRSSGASASTRSSSSGSRGSSGSSGSAFSGMSSGRSSSSFSSRGGASRGGGGGGRRR